jgi:hypothetical protein
MDNNRSSNNPQNQTKTPANNQPSSPDVPEIYANDAQTRANRAVDAFMDAVLRLSNRIVTVLDRIFARIQAINWPRIPLTPFQWVLVLFIALALAYIWATPVFEAGDEIKHFALVEALTEGQLPEQDPENPGPWQEVGNQPPLYYALASALIAPIARDDADQYRERNPFAQIDNPASAGNKNIVLRDTLNPPLEGTVLAVYVLRLLNISLAALTLWSLYRIGQFIAPQRPIAGLVAVGITAFNPMFLFVTGAVDNINLAMAINSVIIYLTLITLREDFLYIRSLILAVLLALATLTHISGVVLLVAVFAATGWRAHKRKAWGDWLLFAGLTLLAFFAFGFWWYVRNVQLYGEFFGTWTAAQIAGINTNPITLGGLFLGFQELRLSFWGLFGVGNIQASALFYAFVDFAVFLSIFGVVFLILQLLAIRDFSYARRELTSVSFLGLTFLLLVTVVMLLLSRTELLSGTSFFPYIGIVVPLITAGFIEIVWWLLFLLSPPERNFVRAGEAVPESVLRDGMVWPMRLLGLSAALIPFFTILPQYMPPQPLEKLPDSAIPVYARFDDVELIGYRHTDRRYIPGEEVPLRFYWRVQGQTETDQVLSVTLLGAGNQPIGSLRTYPGAGRLRTTSWQQGAIYEDTYLLRLSNGISERQPFRVHVRWLDPQEQAGIRPINLDGETLEAVMLDVGAVIPLQLQPSLAGFIVLEDAEALATTFGEQIKLHAYQFDVGSLEVLLNWEALELDGTNYTAFVHVYNQAGELVGQSDRMPLLPTEYWRLAERYLMEHPLTFLERLTPGEYFVEIGWYELSPDQRWQRLALPLPDPLSLPEGIEPEDIVQQDRYRLFNVVVDEEGSVFSPQLEALEPTTTPEAANGETTTAAEATEEATAEATD